MRSKKLKKVMALAMTSAIVLGSSYSNAFAAKTSHGIGEINLTKTTAKAVTRISTASKPQQGFAGMAKITATAKNGKKATDSIMSDDSATTAKVTYSQTKKSNFKKAVSVHKEYYKGSVLKQFNENLTMEL